jgi:hypothetical protein
MQHAKAEANVSDWCRETLSLFVIPAKSWETKRERGSSNNLMPWTIFWIPNFTLQNQARPGRRF